ncbi:MAG: single-stranded DNA-binding protein [Candidatus Paceibacterota bacterium]
MSSRSLNRITLIGNLTRDPELKYTPNGTAVCTFGIATNRSWSTATGETKEDVQFHRVVAWQKLAELCGRLLAKGRKVYMEGRITYRSYTGKDEVQRNITEIVLNDFVLFDDKFRREASTGESTPQATAAATDTIPVVDELETPTDKKNAKGSGTEEKKESPSGPDKKNDSSKKKDDDKTKNKKGEKEAIDPDDIPF